jgi:hypothetical protein
MMATHNCRTFDRRLQVMDISYMDNFSSPGLFNNLTRKKSVVGQLDLIERNVTEIC